MKKKIAFLSVFFFLACFISEVHADIVYLKNGRKMEGKIIKETENRIQLEIEGGIVTLQRDQVARIDKPSISRITPVKIPEKIDKDIKEDAFSYDPYIEDEELEKNPELEHALKTRIMAGDVSDKVNEGLSSGPSIESLLDDIRKFFRERARR